MVIRIQQSSQVSIAHKDRAVIRLDMTENITVTIDITTGSKTMTLVNIYVVPGGDRNVWLDKHRHKIQRLRPEVIVAGGLNAKNAACGSPINDTRGEAIYEWAQVTKFTIDLLVNPGSKLGRPHQMLSFSVRTRGARRQTQSSVKRDVTNLDTNEVIRQLQNTHWNMGLAPETMAEHLQDRPQRIYRNTIPIIRRKPVGEQRWRTRSCILII